MCLRAGAFEAALDLLEDLQIELAGDALDHVLRAWALAGLDEVDEAAEHLTRAELHAARSAWHIEPLLRDATLELADAKRRRRASRPKARRAAPAPTPPPEPPARDPSERDAEEALPVEDVSLRLSIEARPWPAPANGQVDPATALADYRRRAAAFAVERLRRYDTLLSLGVARGVDHYEYQLRTVRRVLRDFRGRALLADEVGLGKTVEACLCLEEYLQRGLARRALLLVPPGLLRQWQDELRGKFDRDVRIVDGTLARKDPDVWRREPLVLASMALARARPHAAHLADAGFDMVIVDEAHRLKNRRTLLFKLVDRIRARYLLLLSATPVENDLVEIYNVLSLLRPGLFSTQAEFKRRFVARGKRTPRDPSALRSLVRGRPRWAFAPVSTPRSASGSRAAPSPAASRATCFVPPARARLRPPASSNATSAPRSPRRPGG
jgi:hypothetical protein